MGSRTVNARPTARILAALVLVASLAVAALIVDATGSRASQPLPVATPQENQPPIRVLLVGDSMAGTLGVGLAEAAADSGVTLINSALIGCGVAIAWDGGWASSILAPGPPNYPCRSADELTAYWKSLLQRYQPDTVIYVNRMDTISQEATPGSTAHMVSVLDPAFRAYLAWAMTQAVDVLSATGAHVILATSAPTKIGLTGNQYDDPRRWAAYDSILQSTAAGSSGRASVFDLGRFFGGTGPTPVFQLNSPSGTAWRCRDGLHFTAAGGVMVAPALFQMAHQTISSPASTAATATSPTVPPSVANQPWAPYQAQQIAMGCVA